MCFAQAREYDGQYGRFHGADLVKGDMYSPITLNKYKYCVNRPLNFVDLTRCTEQCIDEKIATIIQDNTYAYVVGGLDISNASIGAIKKAIVNEKRPCGEE